jgi:hypothetical protein
VAEQDRAGAVEDGAVVGRALLTEVPGAIGERECEADRNGRSGRRSRVGHYYTAIDPLHDALGLRKEVEVVPKSGSETPEHSVADCGRSGLDRGGIGSGRQSTGDLGGGRQVAGRRVRILERTLGRESGPAGPRGRAAPEVESRNESAGQAPGKSGDPLSEPHRADLAVGRGQALDREGTNPGIGVAYPRGHEGSLQRSRDDPDLT